MKIKPKTLYYSIIDQFSVCQRS